MVDDFSCVNLLPLDARNELNVVTIFFKKNKKKLINQYLI